jgi:hypothetical protein
MKRSEILTVFLIFVLSLPFLASVDAFGSTGAIEGNVYLESGVPAEGAMVSISGSAHYAFADRFGRYSFSLVDVGQRDLLIAYDGYYPEWVERVPVTSGNTTKVRDVLLYQKRLPLGSVSSLGEYPAFTGKAAGGFSGVSVSDAGDVNGDGFADILIGAYRAGPGGKGETYLIYGSPTLSGTLSGTISLSDADVTFKGKAAYDSSGYSVSGAGRPNPAGNVGQGKRT